MFSGRVGANNAAELGTMTVTEQLDGLRALAIEPIALSHRAARRRHDDLALRLVVVGNVVAITGGALFGKLLLNVELSSFLHSFADNLKPWDLSIGLVKAVVFGLASRSPAATSASPSRAAPSASAARSTTPSSPPRSPS